MSGLRVHLLVLVNGTRDDTVRCALRWSIRRGHPLTVVDVDFAPSLAHAGAARRLALELAGLGAAPDTPMLTTDADARPALPWVARNVAHLRAGATLVCGRIALDPREAVGLSSRIDAVGEIEGRYKQATLELADLLDPDPWNRWPHHGAASGASLAIRAGDLVAIGGVPLVPCGEDRALARRVRAHGLGVVHAGDVRVEVSCRLRGRAAGGMAEALRERARDPNPLCDEGLEPAAVLLGRLEERGRLRSLWPIREARHEALVGLGIERMLAASLARLERFETAWDRLEDTIHEPSRTRLRVEDLRRELPRLHALLERARGGPGATSGRSAGSRAAAANALPRTRIGTEPDRPLVSLAASLDEEST